MLSLASHNGAGGILNVRSETINPELTGDHLEHSYNLTVYSDYYMHDTGHVVPQ